MLFEAPRIVEQVAGRATAWTPSVGAQAARRSLSSRLSHFVIWFQLVKIWVTTDFRRRHALAEEQLLEALFVIQRRLESKVRHSRRRYARICIIDWRCLHAPPRF
jgi:hypothetical protein